MCKEAWIDVQIRDKTIKAIQTVADGVCKRVDVNDDIKVYACKNIIRIDIKNPNG